VPFGRGKQVGVVVAIEAETTLGGNRLKQVIRLLDEAPLLDAELMQTLAWAAERGFGLDRHHHADLLTAAERHQHPATRARLAGRGRQVVEQGRQWDWQGNAKDGGHGYLVSDQCNCAARGVCIQIAAQSGKALRMSCAHFLFDYRETGGK
jgi:primosomal protein N'